MGLRINTNITALIAHRNLTLVDFQLQKSIERLSSGLRINRASDDPASFITSEQMRTQIEGIGQAINNTVDSISMLQTAEGAFDQIESLIRSIRTLTLHAVNTGPNDADAIANDQVQIQNAIESLNNIATTRKYGSKVLLDGSNGRTANSNAWAATLYTKFDLSYTFMRMDADTTLATDFRTSGTAGTIIGSVMLRTTQANLPRIAVTQAVGEFGNGSSLLDVDETLTINGVTVKLTAGMDFVQVKNAINAVAAQTGASAVIMATNQVGAMRTTLVSYGFNSTASFAGAANRSSMTLRLYARNPGKDFSITVTSDKANSAGRTSGFGGATVLQTGRDPVGFLRVVYLRPSITGAMGTRASFNVNLTGKGNVLTAADTPVQINVFRRGFVTVNFKGLGLALSGPAVNVYKHTKVHDNFTNKVAASMVSITPGIVGSRSNTFILQMFDAPLNFQIGPNKGESTTQGLSNMKPDTLGLSGRLNNIDVRSQIGANSALTVVDEALSQVLLERGRLGAFQKQFLESTKDNLAVYRENYSAAESNIRDTDVASEMISFTRTQILLQSGTAMLAQANLAPQSVLQLLR